MRSERSPHGGRAGQILAVLASVALLAPLALALRATAADAPGTPEPHPSTEARRTLPRDLVPSLEEAPEARPRAYRDGCHARTGDTRARVCTYGDADASFSVLLMGDSHAVQWLPALEDLADQQGWRLYSLTKSACPVPQTPVLVRGKRLRDCEVWRKAAFERIAELRPDIVLAASLGRIYRVPGVRTAERRERAWRNAWTRSLEALRTGAGRVFLLGDTPMWREDPIECLRRHRRDIGRCDTPRSDAISARTEATERAAAARAGVTYLPTADLVCSGDPCHAVEGRYLVLGDVQHMTVAWARRIAPALLDRLTCEPTPVPSSAPGVSPAPLVPLKPSPSASGSPARGTAPLGTSPPGNAPLGTAPATPSVDPSSMPAPETPVSCPR